MCGAGCYVRAHLYLLPSSNAVEMRAPCGLITVSEQWWQDLASRSRLVLSAGAVRPCQVSIEFVPLTRNANALTWPVRCCLWASWLTMPGAGATAAFSPTQALHGGSCSWGPGTCSDWSPPAAGRLCAQPAGVVARRGDDEAPASQECLQGRMSGCSGPGQAGLLLPDLL